MQDHNTGTFDLNIDMLNLSHMLSNCNILKYKYVYCNQYLL